MDATTLSQSTLTGSFSDLLTKIKEPTITPQQPVAPRWSEQDILDLKHYCEEGKKKKDIADLLGRSEGAVAFKARKLGLSFKQNISDKHKKIISSNYSLYGPEVVAKQTKLPINKVRYEAKKLGLNYKACDQYNPPIPKSLLPYHMVKRVSFLDRDCPLSKNKVDDCVVVLYDKEGPSTPMMSMHLDDLLSALEQHFSRRAGVVTGALLSGYRA